MQNGKVVNLLNPLNQGFTYIGLLIIIAIAGINLAGVGTVWHQDNQREKEKELLFIGEAFRQAIGSYYESSPNTDKQFPLSLNDLVIDKRFLIVKRHIRKLYLDPFTQKDWGIIMHDGKIVGIYSTSTQVPIKKSGFPPLAEINSAAKSYSDWRFVYDPNTSGIAIPDNPDQNLGL